MNGDLLNDDLSSFDENELSADDLKVLQDFEAMDSWGSVPSPSASPPVSTVHGSPSEKEPIADDFLNEMLTIFIAEAEEDIGKMRRALNQLEQDEQINPARFVVLRRAAHKLRGTAGAVECHAMATIAHHIELIAEQVTEGLIFPIVGGNALSQAVSVLELLQRNLITYGSEQEGEALLAALETVYSKLNIDLQQPIPAAQPETEETEVEEEFEDDQEALISVRIPTNQLPELEASRPFIRVDAHRFEHLIQHSEQLAELRAPLEHAQAQVESALQDLHAAQARLQQLEPSLPTLLASSAPPTHKRDRHISSSLIARILNEATQHNTSILQRRIKARTPLMKTSDPATWDELEMERYSEKDMLIRSFMEAIADVSVCTARVRSAYGQLELLLQDYMAQVATVRSDMRVLRLAPFSTLIPRLQRAIRMSALAQGQEIQFDVSGETTEIDEEILEGLAKPLLQLLRTCVSDTLATQDDNAQEPYRIWLHARGIGNEITIEIGFSMTVQGGAVDAVREPIQRLNGTISLQRNLVGGVSFFLRFPRSHSAAPCLLIRAGNQHLIVPTSQVLRVSETQRERFNIHHHLSELLGFPAEAGEARVRPVLVLAPGAGASRMTIGVTVDEIISDVELVVKPLKPYLQRPGIAGAAVDGKGRVLLMVDLPELVRRYAQFSALRTDKPGQMSGGTTRDKAQLPEQPDPTKILIADDSVYLRQSLQQILQHAHYTVLEARDGMEALEQLLENRPEAFLLDVEMPNLNGFDLLSIMQLYPELASVRIIMLTSRTSEKHIQRARELGAHAYLTKPCGQETLLQTIQEQLARQLPS